MSVIKKISVGLVLKYKHKNHNLKRSQNNLILEEIYFFVFLFFIINGLTNSRQGGDLYNHV